MTNFNFKKNSNEKKNNVYNIFVVLNCFGGVMLTSSLVDRGFEP